MSIEANPFEELSRLASLNRWCLDPACTTCGNHHLSVGLALIAQGVPLSAWDHTTTRWPAELVPRTRWRLGLAESARLAEVLVDADLSEVKKKYMSPLLDCLELVLVRSGLSEADRDRVEKAWSERHGRESRMEKEERRLRFLQSIEVKHPGFLERDIHNGFEKLCHLAALNDWAWSIRAYFSNHHLRVGLALIARDIPFDEWDYMKDQWPNKLLPLPSLRRWISLQGAESERLAEVLVAADLTAIRKDVLFRWLESSDGSIRSSWPREYWLGYLGVVLHRARFTPEHREQVGKSWRAQLNRMAGSLAPDSQPLIFEELKTYERRLSQERIEEIYGI